MIVDREMQALTSALTATLSDPDMHPRQIVERAALALLTYIEENADGFQVLVRDSPSTDPAGSFSSLLGDISLRVEDLLTAAFRRQKLSVKGVPYYAQMLVGMTVFTGQYWADRPKVSKEQLAAYIVDLAWHGLSRLDSKPTLRFEGRRAKERAAQIQGKDTTASTAREALPADGNIPTNGDGSDGSDNPTIQPASTTAQADNSNSPNAPKP